MALAKSSSVHSGLSSSKTISGLGVLRDIASVLPFVSTPQADWADFAIADGENHAMRHAIEKAERAEAGFAVILTIVVHRHLIMDVGGPRERQAMLCDVGLVFGGVELDRHSQIVTTICLL